MEEQSILVAMEGVDSVVEVEMAVRQMVYAMGLLPRTENITEASV